jgi:hypothetical protein
VEPRSVTVSVGEQELVFELVSFLEGNFADGSTIRAAPLHLQTTRCAIVSFSALDSACRAFTVNARPESSASLPPRLQS